MSPHRFHPDQAGETFDSDGIQLLALPESVRFARRQASTVLSKWDLGSFEDQVVLVVSEYATNAVAATGPEQVPQGYAELHDGTPPLFGVLLRRTATHLLVEVSDVSGDMPLPRDAGELEEDGRGLVLVTAHADHVGWLPIPGGGKRVWAAWDLTGTAASAAVAG